MGGGEEEVDEEEFREMEMGGGGGGFGFACQIEIGSLGFLGIEYWDPFLGGERNGGRGALDCQSDKAAIEDEDVLCCGVGIIHIRVRVKGSDIGG